MKITVEINDFDIYGNNDESPNSFSQELKEEVIKELVKVLTKKHESTLIDIEKFGKSSIQKIEMETYQKIKDILDKQEEKTNEYINSLRK